MESFNPLPIKNIGDPFILKAQGRYYLYATSAPDGFMVWQSKDLLSWSEPEYCYRKSERSFGRDCFWAPEVYFLNDQYYMYYTAQCKTSQEEDLQIGVAVSATPEGPFVDVYDKEPLSHFGYGVLDGHVFCDDDNQLYLYYSRAGQNNFVDGYREADIYVVRLNGDGITVEGEPVLLIQTSQEWERASKMNQFWNEGPFVVKHDGKYHMMYSANFFASKYYGVGGAVSESPMGPYEKYPHNPILSFVEGKISGPGHNSVVEALDGKTLYCVYHAHTDYNKPSENRQVYIDPLVFENGYIKILGPTKR